MQPDISLPSKQAGKFPALAENSSLRYFSFSILYIAQGIPEGITIFAIPAWMAMNGKTPVEIGAYVAVVMLPFSLKILVAPLIERFTFLPMGRRRPWIIFGQLGIVLSFMTMSFLPNPLENISLMTALGFCVSIFITFQDIATDALVIDIVPMHQQARANGFMWGAKIIGTAASLALGTWLINHYGFFTAVFSLSLMVILIMLVPLLLRERPGEKLLPWTTGATSPETSKIHPHSWAKIFKSLWSILKLPNNILLVLTLFIMLSALAFMRTLFPIFTIQALGWSNQEYSQIYASTSLVGGILGMLAGGFLLERFGKIRMISVYLIILMLLTAIMAFSKSAWGEDLFIMAYMAAFNTLFVFSAIGLFATAMQCCWKRISALQFTLYMAIYNLGQAAGAALIGPLRNNLSWQYTILSFSAMAAIALIVIQFMRIKNHLKQVEELENKAMTAEMA